MRNSRRTFRGGLVSIFVALCATALWLGLSPFIGEHGTSFARVVLFIAPTVFGFLGAFIGVFCGAVPIAYIMHDYALCVELSAVLFCIAAVTRCGTDAPGYIGAFFAWSAVLLPARMYAQTHGWPVAPMTEEHFFEALLRDTLFSLLAGSIVMNPGVWYAFTQRSRTVRLHTLLSHLLTLTGLATAITMLAGFSRLGIPLQTLISPHNLVPVLVLGWSTVLCTTLISYWMAYIITRDHLTLAEPEAQLSLGAITASEDDYWSTWLADSSRIPNGNSFPRPIKEHKTISISHTNALLGVCAIDADGIFLYANDAFRALTNIVLPGICGHQLAEFTDNSPIVARIQTLLRTTPPNRELRDEVTLTPRQGVTNYIEIALRPHLADASHTNADGATPRVITVRDITNRRRVNAQVFAAHRLKSLDSFVHGASIRCADILSAIVARATHGLHVNNVDTMRDTLTTIASLAHDGATFAREMFELSAPQNSSSDPHVCDLLKILSERVGVWNELGGGEHSVTLSMPDHALVAPVDVPLLTFAITELVNNARMSYADRSGEIQISLAEETLEDDASFLHVGARAGTFARIRVTDQGCGMSADLLQRCTDPSLVSTQEPVSANGDLSTVFSIVREHGGFMTVESRQDKGTSVCLYLPLAQQPIPTTELSSFTPNRKDVELPNKDLRVTIVNQRDELRSVIADMVTSLGYETHAFSSCDEALRESAPSSTDLIIIDETLGDAAIQRLVRGYKQHNDECRTLLLTVSPHVPLGCPTLCDELLIKPFDIADLRAALVTSPVQPRRHSPELQT